MISQLVAVAILAQAPQSQAPCYSLEDMSNMAVVATPFVLDAAVGHCRPSLQPEAFILNERGTIFAQRMRNAALPRRAAMIAGFRRTQAYPIPATANDEEAITQIGEVFGAGMAGSMSPRECRAFNALMESISDLSPANIGLAFASIYDLAVREESTLCPA